MKPDREEVLRMAREAGLFAIYESDTRRIMLDSATQNLECFAAHFFEAGARAERTGCANWLRQNANAEKDQAKRDAFIEAHNAILKRPN